MGGQGRHGRPTDRGGTVQGWRREATHGGHPTRAEALRPLPGDGRTRPRKTPRGPAATPHVPRRAEGTARAARRPGTTGAEDEGGGAHAAPPTPPHTHTPNPRHALPAGKAGHGRAETKDKKAHRGVAGDTAAAAPGGGGGESPEGTRRGGPAKGRRARGGAPPSLQPSRHPAFLRATTARSAAEAASRGRPRTSRRLLPLFSSHPSRALSLSLVPRDQRAGTAPARPRRTGEDFAS